MSRESSGGIEQAQDRVLAAGPFRDVLSSILEHNLITVQPLTCSVDVPESVLTSP